MPEAAVSSPVLARAALVTGAARRIGAAIATRLARAGYAVAVHAHRSGAEAQTLVDAICHAGGQAFLVSGDLADPAALRSIIAQAAERAGPLTLLVNNASVYGDDAMGTLDPASWDRHFAVNLRAPIFLAQAFADQAPAGRDCCIVNITDQRVFKPTPRQLSYTLTKGALGLATVAMAQALAPTIRVNAVAPGPVLPSPRQDASAFATQVAALPLGHGPTPEDIAEAVIYLAGATRVSGVTIAVDGGQHLAWMTPDAALEE
jgi:NAD(P)-dependent dehydrogenase (short-subunit alcohol dehydrogenase family)